MFKHSATIALVLALLPTLASAGQRNAVPTAAVANDTIFMSWSPNALIDTLEISASGKYICYALYRGGTTIPDSFGLLYGFWVGSSGITIDEAQATLPGASSLTLEGRGPFSWRLTLEYHECERLSGLNAVAAFVLNIDADKLAASPNCVFAAWSDEILQSPSVLVGDQNCTQYAYFTLLGTPAYIELAPVPTTELPFGSLKALYR
ncbi:MAG: hypothetical protein GY838_00015 [bacterium]|nr:hypothetical protein [bacterium]